MNEKRESVRHDSLNLVSYILLNADNDIISTGVGRTLNISCGGILLEIEDLVDDDIRTVRMEIALGDSIISLDGGVRFTLLTTQGYTEYGIQFRETSSESMEHLQKYLDDVLGLMEKRPGLLRSKEARIESLETTLAEEHRVISEYIESYKNMAENRNDADLIYKISKLLTFLKKDLSDHFYFEENVIFKAAESARNVSEKLPGLALKFRNDHALILETLDEIIPYIRFLMGEAKNTDDFIIRKIFLFMGQTKKHAREEMELLVPLMDSDKEIIRQINALLLSPEPA